MTEAVSKQYVECGVQTDDHSLLMSPILSRSSFSQVASPDTVLNPSDSVMPASSPRTSHSRSSTQFDSAYSYTEEPTDPTSPVQSISTNVRSLKRQQLPFNRPSRIVEHKAVSSRVTSLPETVSAYSAKATLERTVRVVSMPMPAPEDTSLLLDELDVSASSGDVFLSEDEQRSRIRIGRRGSDLLRTPSPPSSPESVLIIANKDQLSAGFLRNNVHIEDSPSTVPDDEGWITWAKSPPRPIPALHGPLSLPYARCPSGAEGTIIEEQDNLPRMIWGLEGEDMSSSKSRADSTLHVPSTTSFYRGNSHSNHSHMPPRFQKPKVDADLAPQFEKLAVQDFPRSRASFPDRQVHLPSPQQRQRENLGYPLRGQEPIDLSNIIRQRQEIAMDGYSNDYELSSNRALGPSGHDRRSYDYNNELGLDWQSALLAQEKFLNAGFLSTSPSVHELGDHLSPAFSSSSSSSLPYLGSFRSPIILEPRSSQFPQQAHKQPTQPRRMSALEIAQKYRQQQLHQQQSMLPTPPNSTSPIWSSNFSPYQDSLISPELLSVSRLSKLSPTTLHQHPVPLRSNDSQQPRRSAQERLNNSVLGFRGLDTSFLAPAAQMDGILLQKAQARSLASCLSDPAAVAPLSQILHARNRNAANISFPPRLRSISHQQTRSIPLARLIQRRLSSVPEEDVGEAPTANSPRLGQRVRSFSSGSPAGATPRKDAQLLSPPTPLKWPLRAQSPAQSTLVPQSRGGEALAESERPAQATVRLPGKVAERGGGKDSSGRRREGAKDGGAREHEMRGRGQKRGGAEGEEGVYLSLT
ncbi:hypothetical protein B0H21DRAFT_727296 [Amylocystis lapponica]|nr:hypothetical protein B0H21DRAFT_727296 [Amylocystis lapponica]